MRRTVWIACHATARCGLLAAQLANERVLWQYVQLTPSACDVCIIMP